MMGSQIQKSNRFPLFFEGLIHTELPVKRVYNFSQLD